METFLASDDSSAREAVDLFLFRAAREIDGLTASLGGLDGLVFAAGIDHAPEISRRICSPCAWPDVAVGERANDGRELRIDANASCVARSPPANRYAMSHSDHNGGSAPCR